jgi:hypothetical protein
MSVLESPAGVLGPVVCEFHPQPRPVYYRGGRDGFPAQIYRHFAEETNHHREDPPITGSSDPRCTLKGVREAFVVAPK